MQICSLMGRSLSSITGTTTLTTSLLQSSRDLTKKKFLRGIKFGEFARKNYRLHCSFLQYGL